MASPLSHGHGSTSRTYAQQPPEPTYGPNLSSVRQLVEHAPKRLQALFVPAAGTGLRSGRCSA